MQGRNHCREKIDVLVDGNVISTDFSAPANTVDRLAWPGKHIALSSSNNVESIYSLGYSKIRRLMADRLLLVSFPPK